jgi:hypothetical protein
MLFSGEANLVLALRFLLLNLQTLYLLFFV